MIVLLGGQYYSGQVCWTEGLFFGIKLNPELVLPVTEESR
jgi:hypothetical protein